VRGHTPGSGGLIPPVAGGGGRRSAHDNTAPGVVLIRKDPILGEIKFTPTPIGNRIRGSDLEWSYRIDSRIPACGIYTIIDVDLLISG
jgi:hypothetical protein